MIKRGNGKKSPVTNFVLGKNTNFVTLSIVLSMDQTYQGSILLNYQQSPRDNNREITDQSTVKGLNQSFIIIPKKVTTKQLILTSTKGIDLGNKVRHVAFLKVHKAASSTAQNIFLRFGWARNLTFVLSSTKIKFGYSNVISSTESLTKSNILPKPNGKQFDILCNHVIYNKSAFEYFLPNDTIYIGIVREPYEQYKSTLNYFHLGYIFKNITADFPASVYIRDPLKYEPLSIFTSWTNNRQALEFGFPLHLFSKFNTSEVKLILEKLASEFKLVIISEQMEESVILMRRYLHWNMKDVVFLDQNVALKRKKNRFVQPHDRHFYRKWAKLDYELYEFFLRRLRAQIRDQGPDFDDELILFKEVRKNTSIFCLNDPKEGEFISINESRWSESFNITWELCQLLMMEELPFLQIIRERQYGPMDICRFSNHC
ncbi:hypothetical protein ACJMK2_021877 [Sinanodonta woodiana]|uniref:Uncharacterized protein n=1 Tax=Sinanodonta woodiana TaxID=1069815 RepID=A0ABD3TIB7_SINWO